VRWEKWPSASVDASFITHGEAGSEQDAVKGVVVRSPIIANQPITKNAIVHADAAGFMAAMLTPGMRAVSIVISAESGAGGFVLPNDRIDVIQTRKVGESAISRMVLSNVRVLAVDQTFSQEKDTKTVIAKTATVEVTPEQAELLSSAQSAGQLSLALRPLGDTEQAEVPGSRRKASLGAGGPVAVIRYGMIAPSNPAKETPQ
jgi:pilus assembly protein CpaB